ncbi:MAG: nucleoside recognition domain-containing protein [Desulfuromonadales bacterium]|nr:nucleoside recognition domain-containing protein [Desulfuromonadales bacterium]
MEAFLVALGAALLLAGKLALIIIPLVTLFEVMRYLPFFRRAGKLSDPLMHGMGLSRDAALPLFTGIFLGIAYGAGIIIRVAQEKQLPKRELFLMGLFLATCHAVIEDTLIFVAIGGNGWQMLGIRVLLAVGFTGVLAHYWRKTSRREDSNHPAPDR